MLRSKRDVDKHVQDLLKKVSNENERKLLGFNFAKSYHQIGEHKLAKQHLAAYLAVKECSAPGHRLAGQIAEALGEKEAAVRSYRRSYDLDSSQRDLVFKICSLICELPASPANRDLQQCWLERAEALQPQHSVVFELKQRLMLSSQTKGVVEDQLKNEMLSKPGDMKLRIHLLKLYLDSNRIKEAYDHMLKIESLQVFSQELDWYNCALNVLEAYKKLLDHKVGPDFYLYYLNVMDRLSFLKISRVGKGHKSALSIAEVLPTLQSLDVTLQLAKENGVQRDVLIHFTCQMYFQVGLVVLLKALAGLEDEHLALSYAATLFTIAYNQGTTGTSNQFGDKKIVDSIVMSARNRQSQCGHCIVAWESKEGRKWVVDTVKKWDNPDGRRRMFETAFGGGSSRPYFGEQFQFPREQLELPSFADLLELDKAAILLSSSDLHPVVWLGLRYFTMHRRLDETDFASDLSQILSSSRFMRDIPFAAASWNSCAPETLSALDMEAFVYASIYSTVSLEENDSKVFGTVPAALTKFLCTDQQSAWWQSAIKLISGTAKENLSELRRTLQRGLEVIRLSGNHHGIPLELVAKLARTFMARAGKSRVFPAVDVPAPISTDVMTVEQTEALETQATRYWKIFLDMAKTGNRYTPPLTGRLFEYRTTDVDIDELITEAKLFTGYQLWRSGRREEAQRLLQSISDPYASYYQGLLFKEMAEEELRKGVTVYESRSAANVLLHKSRDAFYITLDRLRSPGMDRFHPLDQKLAEVIEKVETKLGSLTNLSVANGHSTEEEEESEEREYLTPQQVTSTPHRKGVMNMTSMRNGTSLGNRLETSVRGEARPSPERLDAQLRQMVHRQEEFNQAISNELKQIRAEVVDIKTLIQKLESHLELQAKQEVKDVRKKSAEKVSDTYDERAYEDGDVEDWEEHEEEEETDLDNLVKLQGKLKTSGPSAPHINMPLYAPPFAPATRTSYGYPPTYGAPFHPSAYQQYPGFPYAGVPGAPGPFPVTPTYGYPPGFPHWGMEQVTTPSPGSSAYLPPGGNLAAPLPQQVPAQPPASSVFSRMGTKDTSLLAATLQQPAVMPSVPTPINDVQSASDALRRAAAGYSASSTAPVPHAYQINLPAQTTPEKVVDTTLAPAIQLSTSSLLKNIPVPEFSSVTTPDKSLKATRDRKASSCSDASYAPEEEIDNYPDFKPIIPLPEEVEVKTGEEGEDVLFDQRAKLFRFADSQWKERGVGQLKLLQDPTTKKVRLLMRRDQVFKICANHYVTADIKLTEMNTSANSWIWAAMDFADGEAKLEKFAAKFKTVEISTEFKQAFEKAKAADVVKVKSDAEVATSKKESQAPVKGFGDKFAPKSGSWACSVCYVNNSQDVIKCAACETPKPGTQVSAPAATSFSQMKFGMPSATSAASTPTTGFTITPAVTTAPTSTGFSFASTHSTGTTPFSSMKFGVPTSSAATSSTSPSFTFSTSTVTAAISAPASLPTTSLSTTTSSTTTTPIAFGTIATPSSAVTTGSGLSFGTAKPAFSFTLPSTTEQTVSKAPFSFSPPKLAAATTTPQTNGQSDAISKATPSATAGVTSTSLGFSSSVLGTPKSAGETKPVFGGFSFTSNMATTGTAEKPQEEKKPEVKPSPFAGFSFSSNLTPAAAVPGKALADEKKSEEKPSPFSGFVFGGGLGGSLTKETGEKKSEPGMLFSLLAQQQPSTGFTIAPNKEFPGAGAPLFGSSTPSDKNKGNEQEGEDTEGEHYEPNVVFEPVVPLPALIEVSTGEEEENVLFSDRAFLYRYVSDTKEWKEKGRGDMKILEHKTTGRIRLLMRREQVLKICCNHFVTPQLSLKHLQTSDRTWTWSAQDFSEGELVQETFALKFKTKDQADKFMSVFDEAQKKSANFSSDKIEELKETKSLEPSSKSFGEKFKPKEGSWECQGCFLRNDPSVLKCPSCETIKPGEPTKTEQPSHKPQQPSASVQQPPSTSFGDKFKPKEGSWECQGCFSRNDAAVVKCPCCETMKPGAPVPAAAPSLTAPTSQGTPFKFGSDGGFKFGTLPSSNLPSFGTNVPAPASTGAAFGNGFNFSMRTPTVTSPSRPTASSARSPNVSVSSDNEYYEEGESDNIHFEPIIPLPEKIQVKTGEEDEEVVYCHRAKLFRLVDGEWKERGLGDVKVLKQKTTGKSRLLMRREQILKICLNHAITPDLIFKPKDEKSWLWATQDFTEGEGKMETFVIRFRDAETSKAFMNAVKENMISTVPGVNNVIPAENADDVELVYAKEATAEQKRKAAELKLPLNFFLYEDAPPCPGCRGCEPEDDAVVTKPEVVPKFNAVSKAETPTPSNVISFSKMVDASASQLSFSSLVSSAGSGFNKPAAFSWSGTGQPIFGAGSPASQQDAKPHGGDEDKDEVPESNDPHFEPIIPLPALVEVKTGEEDEEVIFSHRAKLYRYVSETKEWKEKGVGDMKILYNKDKNTYRILLRRDQIHKLACNHWLTDEMTLKPMFTSTTAWTWFAMDFSQGELMSESFAVRFKTEDQANLFKKKFEECQAALKKGTPAEKPTIVESEVTPVVAATPAVTAAPAPDVTAALASHSEETGADEEDEGEEEETVDEDQDEEEYEDVEESIMFEKRCTLSSLEGGQADKKWVLLGTGNLKIVYDDEMLCARIVVEDGNEILLCDNVIAIETELKVDGKECVWSAIDYSSEHSVHRTFRAQFSSTDAALEFQSMFVEGKQYAEKSDVHDEPDLHAIGYDHSNDDHGDYVEGKF